MADVSRANQTVRPILTLDHVQVVAGEVFTARVDVVNDGDGINDVIVEIRWGGTRGPPGMGERPARDATAVVREAAVDSSDQSVWATCIAHLGARAEHHLGSVAIAAPPLPGWHELGLRVAAGGGVRAEYRCSVHVTTPDAAVPGPVDRLVIEESCLVDGRRVARYSHARAVPR